MSLDPTLRERLRTLADHERVELDARARARVLEAVLPQQARQHTPSYYLTVFLAAAAGAGLLFFALERGPAASGPLTVALDPEPLEPARMVPAQALVPACSAVDGEYVSGPDGAQAFDLGSLAFWSASPHTQLVTHAAARCGIALTLHRGSVAVHARKLAGTPLVVHTALGSVTVQGTIFEVLVPEGGQALTVRVDEGVVKVTAATGAVLEVRAGQALRLEPAHAPERASLDERERNTLRARLGLPAAQSQPSAAAAPSVSPPAVPSVPREQVWRTGELAAPHIAPEPGSSLTDEGRPMKKPRITYEGDTP